MRASAPSATPIVTGALVLTEELPGRALAGGDGAVEEWGQIDAGQGRGDESEEGQRGVASANVGRVEEHAGVGVLLGQGSQAGAGVGDCDEVTSGRVETGLGVA